MMDPPASPHPFQQQNMHHQDQIQRVVSPANQMGHYQAQYAGYDTYHRADDVQHDPRQQVPPTESLDIQIIYIQYLVENRANSSYSRNGRT
jgi:hypothetical protein